MKINPITGAAAILLIMLTASCSKYDDGPALSLATKKSRLCHRWDTKETEYPNGITEQDNSNVTVTYKKSGEWSTNDPSGVSILGAWEFTSDKEKIRTSYQFGGTAYSSESTILRLTRKELWIKADDGRIFRMESVD